MFLSSKFTAFACFVSLAVAQQTPLFASSDAHLSALSKPADDTRLSTDAFNAISADLVNTLSSDQRESLLLQLLTKHDVVDAMRLTGNGEGLDEERLVQLLHPTPIAPFRISEGQKLRLKKAGYSFMDITDNVSLGALNANRPSQMHATVPPVAGAAKPLLGNMDLDDKFLRADIAKLSGFWNRSYRSRWGVLSSNWIHDQAVKILKDGSTNATRTSVIKFEHAFRQNSIIARIEAANERNSTQKEIIIVSAHQDSLNYRMPFFRAPGADDDGSGTVTVLQILRSLVAGEFVPPPNVAVEFQWFAAEEAGLLGSQDVASAYERDAKNVKGVLHMDMVAYLKTGTTPTMSFFNTDVDANLTAFAVSLVEEYIGLPVNMTTCGGGCGSDHMSFTKAGFPAIFATESVFEDYQPHVHTPFDDIHPKPEEGEYSYEHMMRFVKLGIAFVAELAAA